MFKTKFIVGRFKNLIKYLIRYFAIKSFIDRRNLKITGNGERWDPTLSQWKDKGHLARYNFAAGQIMNDTVIDIACGTGYGTEILGKFAQKIIGIDISKEAITYAKWTHKSGNFYKVSDFWSFHSNAEVVVSFETMEHISSIYGMNDICNKLLSLTNKIVIASVPYLEKEGNNVHHVHFNLDESSFDYIRKNHQITFYYQKPDGSILNDKNNELIQN